MAEILRSLLEFLPSAAQRKRVVQLGGDDSSAQVLRAEFAANVDILQPSAESFQENVDFLYSANTFANLSDDASSPIIERSLRALNLNSHILLIEEFSQLSAQSGRSPIRFIDLIQSVSHSENNSQFGFDLIFAKPTRTATNSNRVAFLFSKIRLENVHGFKTLKEFMDHKQYSRNGVLRYEKIFGEGFVSTGGIETTSVFLEELGLKPGQRVLDVGCGIGGGDFYMAQKYGVEVLGLDLASNMIGIAWDRAPQYSNLNVQFEIGDVTKNKFPSNSFDVIYSRDTILHIEDKRYLFSLFKDWLKPGGKVFITDYCCGPKPWSNEYAEYVAQRGYALLTVPEYGQIFTDLGFVDVQSTDVTNVFVDMLKMELEKFAKIKGEFEKEFNAEDYAYLVDGWNAKLVRCGEGHQRWGKFYCQKP